MFKNSFTETEVKRQNLFFRVKTSTFSDDILKKFYEFFFFYFFIIKSFFSHYNKIIYAL